MKTSGHLAVGLALCLGLVACGQSKDKDVNEQVAATSMVEAVTPADQVTALQEASSAEKAGLMTSAAEIRADIKKVKADVVAIQDQLKNNPDQAPFLQSKLDQLNDQLQNLKDEYAKAQETLSDAEGYELLLKFVLEHQVTSLDQLPQKFKEARAQLQQKIQEISVQEEAFLTKIDAALQKLTAAKSMLKSTERMLREKASILKQKPALSEEEQAQLTSITSFLDSARKLSEEKAELAKARSMIMEQERQVAEAQKQKAELMATKTKLMRQLLEISAEDYEGRQRILERLEATQTKLVDADLAIYDHQTLIDEMKAEIIEGEQEVQELQSGIESLAPNLSSVLTSDLSVEMKLVEEADKETQALQTDYQKWRQEVMQNEVDLANISRLEAFFAQKFPDVKPSEPAQPQEPQPEPNSPS